MRTLGRWLRACSSDQKKRLLRQKSSMMFGASSRRGLIVGTVTKGEAPAESTRLRISLSISRSMGRSQQAHSVCTVTDSVSSRKRPCTKGIATASAAQAASRRSPVLNATW